MKAPPGFYINPVTGELKPIPPPTPRDIDTLITLYMRAQAAQERKH